MQQTENPGELIVSWIPPSRDSHNGPLQGYHVKAVPRISGESGISIYKKLNERAKQFR